MTNKRQNIILLVLMLIALGTSLFSYSQIKYFFSKRVTVFNAAQPELVLGLVDQDELPALVTVNSSLENSYASVAGGDVIVSSYQALILDRYFAQEDSPLLGSGQDFISACVKHGAPKDCLLLPAIARIETNLCKAENEISARQFNCWGFGGSGPNRILYPNFATAIDEITRRLMSGYGTRFFNNPVAGERFYCGAHCTSWGAKVQNEKQRINQYYISQGHPSLL